MRSISRTQLIKVAFVALGLSLLAGLPVGAAEPAYLPDASDDPFSPANRFDPAKAANKRANPAALVDLSVSVSPQQARPGQTVKLTIQGKVKEGYHTYPVTKRTPEWTPTGLNQLVYEPNPALQPLWVPFHESEPELDGDQNWVFEKPFTWSQDILIKPDATPGPHTLKLTVKGQACNDEHCIRHQIPLEAVVNVTDQPAVPLSPEIEQRMKANGPEIQVVPASPTAISTAAPSATRHDGLLAFILAGIFWGAISLVTPCVFPMIPITVSFFLKQSEKEHHRPVVMALVYCLTIVVVLTIAAVTLLSFFRWLSVNPLMNFGLGALFVFFALSLFGMYEIELPSSLARFTSAREGKGGLIGTMFMALTFTIISFACVAPFLGGFSGTADVTQLTWLHRILGGVAFSVAFASPFFILALFPALLKKLPKSGSWLNSVKVVMGFLELAAALVFFRTGELVLSDKPVLFTYDFVLGLYVAICLLCGLYLLNVYRLPHDTPLEHLSVPRMLWAVLFLGLGLYLMPGLFKDSATGKNQRPNGAIFAWLDSFMLPDGGKSDLPWVGTLERGLAEASKTPSGLAFVDFTGVTCKNCKYNEENVFSKPEVQDLLKKYALVQLYTDRVPNDLYPPEEQAELASNEDRPLLDAERNLEFQREQFQDERLPLYVILAPMPGGGFREVARYDEGKINNAAAFMDFLRKPLNGADNRTAQANLGN